MVGECIGAPCSHMTSVSRVKGLAISSVWPIRLCWLEVISGAMGVGREPVRIYKHAYLTKEPLMHTSHIFVCLYEGHPPWSSPMMSEHSSEYNVALAVWLKAITILRHAHQCSFTNVRLPMLMLAIYVLRNALLATPRVPKQAKQLNPRSWAIQVPLMLHTCMLVMLAAAIHKHTQTQTCSTSKK